jgi:hypothetical protein
MKKQYLIILLLGLFLINPIFAQYPNIRFEKYEHDFGELMESKGTATFEFIYHNIGNIPVVITDVSTTCGCTKPEYKTDTVHPGNSGVILAKYDVNGRVGEFEKSLNITFNNDRIGQKYLKIKGNVINDIRPNIYKYNIQMGMISLNNSNIIFPEIKKKNESVSILMSNDGNSIIRLLKFDQLPGYMTIEATKMELKPKDTSIITFTIHAAKIADMWGEYSNRINIMTSDPLMPLKIILTSFVKKPDFSHLSKQEIKNAPMLSFSEERIDFGPMQKGAKQSKEITLTNNGKSELIIYKIHAPCYCLSAVSEKMNIAPGETIKIKLTMDTIGRQPGDFSRGVTFYTNDPENSEFIVYGVSAIQ